MALQIHPENILTMSFSLDQPSELERQYIRRTLQGGSQTLFLLKMYLVTISILPISYLINECSVNN